MEKDVNTAVVSVQFLKIRPFSFMKGGFWLLFQSWEGQIGSTKTLS